MFVRRSRIKLVIILASMIIGTAYAVSGFISLYNWLVVFALKGTVKSILEEYIPGNLGTSLILLSIGLILLATVYYALRQSTTKSISCLIVGCTLAVAAMVIQLLTVIAGLVDTLIIGDVVSVRSIILGILRIDAFLGYITIPLFIVSLWLYKKEAKAE